MAVVCMVNSSEYMDGNETSTEDGAAPRLNWTSDQEVCSNPARKCLHPFLLFLIETRGVFTICTIKQ